jgi:hypothetical protein
VSCTCSVWTRTGREVITVRDRGDLVFWAIFVVLLLMFLFGVDVVDVASD